MKKWNKPEIIELDIQRTEKQPDWSHRPGGKPKPEATPTPTLTPPPLQAQIPDNTDVWS